jgi:hypothetical protein
MATSRRALYEQAASALIFCARPRTRYELATHLDVEPLAALLLVQDLIAVRWLARVGLRDRATLYQARVRLTVIAPVAPRATRGHRRAG